ncbi:MAG: hypothetical protein JOZ49_14505 [Mycolicibacterium sp.]|nr:hypothetical protein [Mycolicibacterium sp.]
MQVELSHEEAEVTARVLRNYLGDLSMEIRDAEDHAFREALKADKQVILGFLQRLSLTAEAPA